MNILECQYDFLQKMYVLLLLVQIPNNPNIVIIWAHTGVLELLPELLTPTKALYTAAKGAHLRDQQMPIIVHTKVK